MTCRKLEEWKSSHQVLAEPKVSETARALAVTVWRKLTAA
jgi:hypothetical protein